MDRRIVVQRAGRIAGVFGFSAAAAVAAASPALAQEATPAYATRNGETIQGTIASVGGKYAIAVDDERGYLDRVTLHQGTVIVPTGVSLAAGQKVTIHGHADGKTFAADEIDTDGAGDTPSDGGYGYAPYGTIGGGYVYPAYGTPYYGGPYYGSGIYAPGAYGPYGTYGGVYYAPGTTIITVPAPAAPAAPATGTAPRGIVPGPLPYVRHAPPPAAAQPFAASQRLAPAPAPRPPQAAPHAAPVFRSAPALRR